MATAHLINGGLLNPYLLGKLGLTNDPEFSLPNKLFIPRFSMAGQEESIREGDISLKAT